MLIVVVGGLANTSCHGLNFPTFRNNLLKAVETGESTREKLRIWLSKYARQIWLLIIIYEKILMDHLESVALPPLVEGGFRLDLFCINPQTKWIWTA